VIAASSAVAGSGSSDVAELEPGRQRSLELQQPALELEAPAVAAEPVRCDHAMTGNEHGKRIPGHERSDLTGIVDTRGAGELAVGDGAAEGSDLAQRLEHPAVIRVDARPVQRNRELLPLPAHVLTELGCGLRRSGRGGARSRRAPNRRRAGKTHPPHTRRRRLDPEPADRRVDDDHRSASPPAGVVVSHCSTLVA